MFADRIKTNKCSLKLFFNKLADIEISFTFAAPLTGVKTRKRSLKYLGKKKKCEIILRVNSKKSNNLTMESLILAQDER